MSETIRVCAYCRVSTDSKDQQNSLENQQSYFEREIAKNEQYTFVDIYADRGVSGTKLNRPEFDRMLIDAGLDIEDGYKVVKKAKFDLIMVKNTSRFARNVSVDVILKALKRNKIYVYFLDLNKTTQNDEDITYIQIFQSFDERESRDKSKKTRFGHMEGARQGKIAATFSLYGYTYIKTENRLEINEAEASIVRLIFEMYANGLGAGRIKQELTAKGIYTRNGKIFKENTLQNMVLNKHYIGISVRNKFMINGLFAENTTKVIRDESEWIVCKTDRIPPIISDELFYKCEEVYSTRINTARRKGINRGITKYAQMIYCANCKGVFVSSIDKYGARYYLCKNKKINGVSACSSPNIKVEVIDEIVTNTAYYERICNNKARYIARLKRLIKLLEGRLNVSFDEKVGELKSELAIVKAKHSRYIDLYADGVITTKDELNTRIEPLNEQIQQLEADIKHYSKANNEILQDIDEVKSTIAELEGIAYKDSYTEKEILNDIEYILAEQDKTLVVRYKTEERLRAITSRHNELWGEARQVLSDNDDDESDSTNEGFIFRPKNRLRRR